MSDCEVLRRFFGGKRCRDIYTFRRFFPECLEVYATEYCLPDGIGIQAFYNREEIAYWNKRPRLREMTERIARLGRFHSVGKIRRRIVHLREF